LSGTIFFISFGIYSIILGIIYYTKRSKSTSLSNEINENRKHPVKLKNLINSYKKNRKISVLEKIIAYYPKRSETIEILKESLCEKNWKKKFIACRHLDHSEGLYSLLEIVPQNEYKKIVSAIFRIENNTKSDQIIKFYLNTNSDYLKQIIIEEMSSSKNVHFSDFLFKEFINNFKKNESLSNQTLETLKRCGDFSTISSLNNFLQENKVEKKTKMKIIEIIDFIKAKSNIISDGWISINKSLPMEGGISKINDHNGNLSINKKS